MFWSYLNFQISIFCVKLYCRGGYRVNRPVGVRPRIPTVDHMGCAPRGGLAHEMKPYGARLCSAPSVRYWEDILKML